LTYRTSIELLLYLSLTAQRVSERVVATPMRAHQDLEQPVRDQLVERQQFPIRLHYSIYVAGLRGRKSAGS
jgi:hypothetical protein